MTEPVFRYIFVLVAVIVVLRILLNVSARKTQQNSDQPTEEAAESSHAPELRPLSQDEQKLEAEDQFLGQNIEEIKNE